jgi:hypothetical protein
VSKISCVGSTIRVEIRRECSSAVGADVYACSRGGYSVGLADIHGEGFVFHLRKFRESNMKNTASKHAHIQTLKAAKWIDMCSDVRS